MALIGVIFSNCTFRQINKPIDNTKIDSSGQIENLFKKIEHIEFGPTLKSETDFVDVTEKYGLSNLQAIAMNAVDLNFDGFTDLIIVPSYYSRPKFFIWNQSKNKFQPWEHDPLPGDFKTSFILYYDLNRDRIPDLVSGVLNQKGEMTKVPLKFYKGVITNGLLHFQEDKKVLNIPPGPTSSVVVLDYNLDGWPDLFVSNWFENRKGEYLPVADLLLQNKKGIFVDVSSLLDGEINKSSDQLYPPLAKPTYGASTCDIDQNGYPDILTVSSSGYKNKLWMNRISSKTGERFFEDMGTASGYASDTIGSLIPTGGGRSFFSACADYNNDGIMDIFLGELSHAYDVDSVDKSSILTGSKMNYPPFFIRTEYLSDANSQSWNQGDRRGIWFDYNVDGLLDLLVDNSGFPPHSRLVLFEQDEAHAFKNVAHPKGLNIVNPAASIVFDFNKDGLPDILTAQNNIRRADIEPRLYLFENQIKIKNSIILKIHLGGTSSASDAVGSMIVLSTTKNKKTKTQRRWLEYSMGGIPSQHESGVIFGIEKGALVKEVKVRWPYLKNIGFSQEEIIEKIYSIQSLLKDPYTEVTLCESGKVFSGKVSCDL